MGNPKIWLEHFCGLYEATKSGHTQFLSEAGFIQDVLLQSFCHFCTYQVGNAAGCHEFTATSKNFWIQSGECKSQQPVEMILHIPYSQMNRLFQSSCDFRQLMAGLGNFRVYIQVSHDILEQICCFFCRLISTESTVFSWKISLTELEKNGNPLALAETNKVPSLEDLFQ